LGEELSGDKGFSYRPILWVLVGGDFLSDDSADSGNYYNESDNTNDAYIVVVNESSVVLGCQGDEIIILGCESVFGNLVDLIIKRGEINVLADLLIDSVLNESIRVQGLFLSLSPCCLHY